MKTKEEIKEICSSIIDSETIHPMYQDAVFDGLVMGYTKCQEDMSDKKYTEADIRKAIELARETESERRGGLSDEWDEVEKYDEQDIIYLLNKKD